MEAYTKLENNHATVIVNYLATPVNYDHKLFIIMALGDNVIKLVKPVSVRRGNKLEWSRAKFFSG